MSRVIKFRVWGIKQGAYLATTEGANYQLYPTYDECREREEGRGVGFRPLGWCLKESHRFTVEQFTGLQDSKGRDIYEGDVLSWISASTPIPHSVTDNRQPQRDSYVGAVTWGIVEDDEYGNDVAGWTLDGTRLHTQEGRADLRASFEKYSLYAVVSRHAKDCSYPDSSWQMSLTACEIIGNLHENPTLLQPTP